MTTFAPIIVLAFANDADDHLQMLTRERKGIYDALQDYEDKSYIRLKVEPNAGINDIFEYFNRYAGQIAIFHYGGHASGSALSLETASGDNEPAHAGGLAKLMGLSAALQLVFLNGCATKEQVQALLANGVKAVIATEVPINDMMATEFAEKFYEALGEGKKTVKDSFEAARAFIAMKYDSKKEIGEFRGMSWGDEAKTVAAGLTWGLYLQPEGDSALAWKLPDQTETELIIEDNAGIAASPPDLSGNDALTQSLFTALAPYNAEVGKLLEIVERTKRQDLRTIRPYVIDAFPSPVGEQLRKLFATEGVGEDRLRQLVMTYETVLKLFAFVSLSQLWDAMHEKQVLLVEDGDWEPVDAFKRLDAAGEPAFDYLRLIVAIDRILDANGIKPFMEEYESLEEQLTDPETAAASRFMDGIRARLAAASIPAAEIGAACAESTRHLGTLLTDLAFLARYRMATIKSIAINKARHKEAEFLHRQVLLSKGLVESDNIHPKYTDNEAVVLLKDLADVSQYLNLTPFVIDENALRHEAGTKIYFYGHHDEAEDAYQYYSIADQTDRRVVSSQVADEELHKAYAPIKTSLDEFRAEVTRP